MIPSISQCRKLMADHAMLGNIKEHSVMVAQVATMLSRELNRAGVQIDGELAVAGALLHDIAKTMCLESGCNHARVGAEICLAHGFAEVADFVGEHVMLRDFSPARLSAKEVVSYADKRVKHHQIVSLAERLEYILGRYGQGDPHRSAMIRENFEKWCQLEERIFSFLAFKPAQVPDLVKESGELKNDYAETG
ncbi:MAG: HDIG domain-containing protein [Deltaproteobacteria bacterium]|jgi:uncharacterized protein|nr:HDIG domain-containing protein [Deltaproteobacteria bacterium]